MYLRRGCVHGLRRRLWSKALALTADEDLWMVLADTRLTALAASGALSRVHLCNVREVIDVHADDGAYLRVEGRAAAQYRRSVYGLDRASLVRAAG